eukprot:TRINITY_DN9465_c0_g1_i1.p1 TRINITY_DN9465_c0_g1~~TRINITY_DN9465_c0_g1_i1.p1  ORF type:complete len:175 (+),score=31.85 TRINITY_DN9465_c0_g1_i1:14-538(+)
MSVLSFVFDLPLYKSIHVISSSLWLGTMFWTSFIAGFIMFKNLPREVFGKLQSHLFPAYFKFGILCTLVSFSSFAMEQGQGMDPLLKEPLGVVGFQMVLLIVSLVSVLINLVVVEPMTTKVMFARHKLEKDQKSNSEQAKKLAKKFGMLHGISSLVNLTAFLSMLLHVLGSVSL